MKKVIRLTENDLARIVKRIIKENEDENMISIPEMFSFLRREMGTKATPEDIISMYNDEVEEGVPLVSYSEDGFFTNEDGEEIEEFIILDELNYASTGGDEGETDYDDDEEDDIPSYKTKWREPSPKRKKFGDGGESEFFLTDNIRFGRFNGRLGLFYQPSENGGGISLSDEQKEMLINFLSK